MNTTSYLHLAYLIKHEAKLVPQVRAQDGLNLLFQTNIARLESMQNQMPVSDLILSVVAQDFKRRKRIIKDSMSVKNVETSLKVVKLRQELVNVIVDQKVFELCNEH